MGYGEMRFLTWATVMTSVITSRDSASAFGDEVNHSSVLVFVSAVKQFHAQFLSPSQIDEYNKDTRLQRDSPNDLFPSSLLDVLFYRDFETAGRKGSANCF